MHKFCAVNLLTACLDHPSRAHRVLGKLAPEETWECGWVFVAKRYVSGYVTNLSERRVMAQ